MPKIEDLFEMYNLDTSEGIGVNVPTCYTFIRCGPLKCAIDLLYQHAGKRPIIIGETRTKVTVHQI